MWTYTHTVKENVRNNNSNTSTFFNSREWQENIIMIKMNKKGIIRRIWTPEVGMFRHSSSSEQNSLIFSIYFIHPYLHTYTPTHPHTHTNTPKSTYTHSHPHKHPTQYIFIHICVSMTTAQTNRERETMQRQSSKENSCWHRSSISKNIFLRWW